MVFGTVLFVIGWVQLYAIFSCLSNIGEVEDMASCENRCRSKNLQEFELNDFYNFADRLNQSNFLIQRLG